MNKVSLLKKIVRSSFYSVKGNSFAAKSTKPSVKIEIKDNANHITNKEKKPVKKIEKKAEPIVEEPSQEIETIKEATAKKVLVKETKSVIDKKDHKSFDPWKVDIINHPEVIGRLPIHAVVNIKDFPKPYPNSLDYFDAYVDSNRCPSETRRLIKMENTYNCRNYAPVPVMLCEGHGAVVEDIEGFKYIDCIMGYSAVNHGHHNENIQKAFVNQVNKLYMTSRAFYTNKLGELAKLITETFGKEKVVFANGGVEAVETAIKIARRYAYRVKKIPENKAKIIVADGNFMGRTTTVCGGSNDPGRYKDFGPYAQDAFEIVPYNDIEAIKNVLEKDPNVCAVLLEPIQGEGGIIIPSNEYLPGVYDLCKKHNVLFIDDEIQAGLGRSGALLASQLSLPNVKPDLILLAKSLSNGYYPVSVCLGNKDLIDLIGPGEHGSTFGGNPLGAATATAGIKEMLANNGRIIANSASHGSILCYLLNSLKSPLIKEVRGRGLFIGIEFHHDIPITTYDIVLMLMEKGLITKQTHKYNIRLTPSLNIGWNEIKAIYFIFKSVLSNISSQVDYKATSEATANFLISHKLKEEADKFLANLPNIEYKKLNPKQESYRLSTFTTLSLSNVSNQIENYVNINEFSKI